MSSNSAKFDLHLPDNAGPMSPYMVAMLRYFDTHEVDINHLNTFHGGTLGAISGRGYLASVKKGPLKTVVTISEKGVKALKPYDTTGYRERTHAAEMTERCVHLLKLSRAMLAAQRINEKPPGPRPVASAKAANRKVA